MSNTRAHANTLAASGHRQACSKPAASGVTSFPRQRAEAYRLCQLVAYSLLLHVSAYSQYLCSAAVAAIVSWFVDASVEHLVESESAHTPQQWHAAVLSLPSYSLIHPQNCIQCSKFSFLSPTCWLTVQPTDSRNYRSQLSTASVGIPAAAAATNEARR